MKLIYINLCSRDMDGQKFNLSHISKMKLLPEFIKYLNASSRRDYILKTYRQKRKCLEFYVALMWNEIEFLQVTEEGTVKSKSANNTLYTSKKGSLNCRIKMSHFSQNRRCFDMRLFSLPICLTSDDVQFFCHHLKIRVIREYQ